MAPIRFIDPDGRIIVDANGNIIATKKGVKYGEAREYSGGDNGEPLYELIPVYNLLEIYTDKGVAIQVKQLDHYARREVVDLADRLNMPLEPLKEGDMEKIKSVDSEFSASGTNCHGLCLSGGLLTISSPEAKIVFDEEFSEVADKSEAHFGVVEWLDSKDYDSHSYVILNEGDSYLYNDGEAITLATKSEEDAIGIGISYTNGTLRYLRKDNSNRIYSKLIDNGKKNSVRILNDDEAKKFKSEIKNN